jgi:5'-methylthioadenosine nucleosidase
MPLAPLKILLLFACLRCVHLSLQGFDTWGIGRFSHTATPSLLAATGYKSGLVTSGNSLDYTAEDMRVMTEHGAAVKEMEAGAIAWVCDLFQKTPFFGVKTITDIVDGDRPTQDEFLENLHAAAKALQVRRG